MSASDEFHPENYRDEVKERIREMIQMKIEGEEITNALSEEPKAQVIDLMEALRASLGGATSKPSSKSAAKAASSKLRAVKPAPAKPEKEERKAPQRSRVSAKTVTVKRGR
jgi:DNA end-binding protein Ku